jgi:hypothetical protein
MKEQFSTIFQWFMLMSTTQSNLGVIEACCALGPLPTGQHFFVGNRPYCDNPFDNMGNAYPESNGRA